MKNALISVFHKEGITDFANELVELGFMIYASGGTHKHLRAAGIDAQSVADLVGGDPILEHRVVTLSREVHAGLLAKDTEDHVAELAELGIPFLDLVCVDMYPLEAEIAKVGSTRESVIENTDIGGPTMIRSGVKGQRLVICDPADRQKVIDWLKAGGHDDAFVNNLGAKGEFTVAKYVMASANYLSGGRYVGFFGEQYAESPYGENGYQKPARAYSAWIQDKDPFAIENYRQIAGAPLSFNNRRDLNRTARAIIRLAAVYEANFGKVSCLAVGTKHGNACGANSGVSPLTVLEKTLAGDPKAIYGGLLITNFTIDGDAAEKLSGKGLDCLIAPEITPDAVERLRRKLTNKLRFLVNPALSSIGLDSMDQALLVDHFRGGFQTQPNHLFVPRFGDPVITKYGEATVQQLADMSMAWAIGSSSTSNTITLVKNEELIGNGAGQQSRVIAAKLSVMIARESGHDTDGASGYSDSFFPFPDGPQVLVDAGVSAIFTSSGSKRDDETIELCQKHGLVLNMVPDEIGRGFMH